MRVPIRRTPTPVSYTHLDVYKRQDLVNDWVQGTHANNGFALVAIAEANNLGASMPVSYTHLFYYEIIAYE